MKRLFLIASVLTFLLASCSDRVTVVVDKLDRSIGQIVIDGKDTFRFRDTVMRLRLFEGTHEISVDGGPQRKFQVGENGGLLNIDNQEYVVYEVPYEDPRPSRFGNAAGPSMRTIILVDSVVIMQRTGDSRGALPDSAFSPYVADLLRSENGNLFTMPSIHGYRRQVTKTGEHYDTDESVHGMKHFGKDRLYIERFWDYDLDVTLPRTITVKADADPIVRERRSKTAVFREAEFLILARTRPDLFHTQKLDQIPVALDLGIVD